MRTLSDDEKAEAAEVTFLPRGYSGASDFEMSDEEIEWSKFIDEMGDALEYAKISVYREPTGPDGQPRGKSLSFLFDCGVGDYSFSQLCGYIRDEYGSGIYRVQLREKGGAIKKNKRIQIEAPKSRDVTRQDGGGVITEMSRAMEMQQRRFEAMLERVAGNQAQHDPIDQMTKMMAAMGAMMGAMGMNPAERPKEKSMIETLTEMKMQRELLSDLFGNSDDGGKVDNFWGAIAKAAESFGGPLMQAIALAQKNGAINNDGVIQPRSISHNPATPPEQPEQADHAEMKQKIQFLVTQAENGVDPADVVQFIIESLPDDENVINDLFDALEPENCIEQYSRMVPAVAKHREWFENWRTLLLSELGKLFDDSESTDLTGDTPPADDSRTDAGESAETEKDTADAAGEQPPATIDADGNTQRRGRDKSNA